MYKRLELVFQWSVEFSPVLLPPLAWSLLPFRSVYDRDIQLVVFSRSLLHSSSRSKLPSLCNITDSIRTFLDCYCVGLLSCASFLSLIFSPPLSFSCPYPIRPCIIHWLPSCFTNVLAFGGHLFFPLPSSLSYQPCALSHKTYTRAFEHVHSPWKVNKKSMTFSWLSFLQSLWDEESYREQ